MTTTVRHEGLREQVAALGAEVIAPEDFAEYGPFDVILELVGAPNLSENLKALATGGRIAVIGVAAGILFDRLAGPSWLARQFSGSTRGIITSALVGIAGAFIGYQIAMLLALGGGLVTSAIAAAVGAAVVLFAWRMAK